MEIDYKIRHREMYDENSREFEIRTKDYLINYIRDDAELFLSNLQGGNILDLGSGPGRDSYFFEQNGFNPLCFDISLGMIKLCKEKDLNGIIGDLEKLPFEEGSFDGVWAYTSLLHMPKSKLPLVLSDIGRILKPSGVIYIGMKEGKFEGWKKSEKYSGNRFFSLYQEEELTSLMEESFEIISNSKIRLGEATFLNYFGIKRES